MRGARRRTSSRSSRIARVDAGLPREASDERIDDRLQLVAGLVAKHDRRVELASLAALQLYAAGPPALVAAGWAGSPPARASYKSSSPSGERNIPFTH
jgi:hypothetical protein